jgi:hypothetical protein
MLLTLKRERREERRRVEMRGTDRIIWGAKNVYRRRGLTRNHDRSRNTPSTSHRRRHRYLRNPRVLTTHTRTILSINAHRARYIHRIRAALRRQTTRDEEVCRRREVEAAVATVEWRVPHTIQVLGQIVDVVAVPTGVQETALSTGTLELV